DAGTMSTNLLGTKDAASQEVKKDVSSLRYIALPNWAHDAILELSSSKPQDHCSTEVPEGSGNPNPTASTSNSPADQIETLTVETPIPTVSSPVPTSYSIDSQEPSNESYRVEADISNMETAITASPTPTLKIHKDHPKSQIIGPVDTSIQTKNKSKEVLKNKKDERGIVIRNKARLVAQRHTREEGIDYDEVFAPVARIEAIRLFLAYASFMGFTVYQMDMKSAFLYGTIDEEVYVMQPLGFQDPKFLAKAYKVEKAMYGLHQAPRAWYGTLSKYLLKNGFQRGTIDQTLFIKKQREDFILVQMSAMGELNFFLKLQVLQKEDGIFLSQDKYVGDILKKFGYSDVRSLNTLMDKENPWGKDETGKDVDLHLYRSMIGSLIYLTASRPNIMFAVCACATYQVTPKECHLHAVKRIFRYLKSHPKLRLWYPKESPFDLVAYSDSDYGRATQDHKLTTRGC
nr:putative ribonuclease H-like domain-containing protein [Tanacetum cinerariifolium]